MRLIDADALMELYDIGKELEKWVEVLKVPVPVIRQNIKDMPTIDAVPVVRCKDCRRFAYDKSDADYYCTISACVVAHNDFCSYGERRGDTDG